MNIILNGRKITIRFNKYNNLNIELNYYSGFISKDLNIDVYRGPQIAAEKVNSLLIDKNSRILDVGAGTHSYFFLYFFNMISPI